MTLVSVVKQAITALGYDDFVKVRKVPKSPDFDLSCVPAKEIGIDFFNAADVLWKSGSTRHYADAWVNGLLAGEVYITITNKHIQYDNAPHSPHRHVYGSVLRAIDDYVDTFFAVCGVFFGYLAAQAYLNV